MLISRLQTSFRSSATSAVNCVIVRETGFDGSNWDMGFIDWSQFGAAPFGLTETEQPPCHSRR
jgi:hypothetical protein